MLFEGQGPGSNLQEGSKDHGVAGKSHPCVRAQLQIFQETQESVTTFLRGK